MFLNLIFILKVFFWLLYCLYFFDLRILNTLTDHMSSPPGCWWGSCCSIFSHLCTFLLINVCFMLLSFFFWSLYCLLFFDLRLLNTL